MLLYISNPQDGPSSDARGRLRRAFRSGPGAPPPPYPPDDRQFDDQDADRGFHHRTDDRRDFVRLEIEGIPRRQASPTAALARESIPDREGDGHEFRGRKART